MITERSLVALEAHWAIEALGRDVKERADYTAKARLVRSAVSGVMQVDFNDGELDNIYLERTAMAYEMAAAEALDALLNPSLDNEATQAKAQAAAFKIYEYRRALPVPIDQESRMFYVLHQSAVAYCGDRWVEQRRWFKEHPQEPDYVLQDGTPWDRRLLCRVYDCWVRLIRKDGWDDLSAISEIITELRQDQDKYENNLLQEAERNDSSRATAFRLLALYNWARASELLGKFILQGEPANIDTEIDRHFEDAREAAAASGDMAFDVVLRWLHVAGRRMVAGSIWTVSRMVNSRVTKFVKEVTRSGSMLELLPPQRVAIQKEGLLDAAKRAIVVDLPTSGGKTALAEFRILQALNQFDADHGWVAYVAPTRALVSQLTRRLRKDFGPLGISVEQLSGAIEVDAFEEAMLGAPQPAFDVLVSTPEKMQFLIRNKKTTRPLALLVLDEAHNLEDEDRGLRIELLLATVKRDCPKASFLLLMPFVPNGAELANWLGAEAGKSISLSTTAWQPNDRVVGMYWPEHEPGRGNWSMRFETLVTTPKTIHLRGIHQVGGVRPLPISYSDANLSMQTGAIARVMSERTGTSIAVARTIRDTWSMAMTVASTLEPIRVTDEIALVQKYLAQEVSPKFALIDLLSKGVGVHHAGLPDEARTLMEWLAESGHLKVLCATSTIAQGLNFPVSAVFLASKSLAGDRPKDITPRMFWNLAGRAGRIDQGSLGVVGVAAGTNPDSIRALVSAQTGDLVSRLKTLMDDIYKAGQLGDLELVIRYDQWRDFRSYIAHLWNEKQNLDDVLAETEQVLRNTFGYTKIRQTPSTNTEEKQAAELKARRLLEATRNYARELANHPVNAALADATGFAPEGVRNALLGLSNLGRPMTSKDWTNESLFGGAGRGILKDLIGVMMGVPELSGDLEQLSKGGLSHRRIADLTQAWVHGEPLEQIAVEYFGANTEDPGQFTERLSETCRRIYRYLTNVGTWGLASLSKIPTSGLNFDELSPQERRSINSLPAMIYYGVHTEAAVLMRMQAVPRTLAERMGDAFTHSGEQVDGPDSLKRAKTFLESLSDREWTAVAGVDARLSGTEYKRIWQVLSGA